MTHTNEIEQAIRQIIARVLEVDSAEIHPTQPLIEQGLDSMRVLQIIAAIEDRFGIETSDIEIAMLHTQTDLVTYVQQATDRLTWRTATLPAMLRAAASTSGELHFLDEKTRLSYRELHANATTLAGKLQARGIERGDHILIVLPTSSAFANIWWAVQLAGAVPCVLPPTILQPASREKLDALRRTQRPNCLITTAQWGADVPQLAVVTVEMLLAQAEADYRPNGTATSRISPHPDDIALIQATSGSTGAPKCVALTHANVLANVAQIGRRLQVTQKDVVVSWLPLFHDMGLIGCFLFAIYWQLNGVLISETQFLRRPQRWLEAISNYRGTLSPAPNFAYALTQARTPAALLAQLDLSCWRSAMCGAEPIDPQVLAAFATHFAKSGFSAAALTPCYGLAEASLCVTMQAVGAGVQVETIGRDALTTLHAIVTDESADTLTVVNCGAPVAGTQVRIIGALGCVLGEGEIGRIWLSGPSIMHAYLDTPAHAGWFDSGDNGYLRNGHLFVLGRHKELIIVRGQNYHPTEFERAAVAVAAVRPAGIAAVGIYNRRVASEELVMVCEVADLAEAKAQTALTRQLTTHIARSTGVPPAQVLFVPRRTLPRTTSGKLQRNTLKTEINRMLSNDILCVGIEP